MKSRRSQSLISSSRVFSRASLLVLLVFVCLVGRSLPVYGQAVYGSIFGTVIDNTGAVVPNATITVTDISKGTVVTVQTNESGSYTVQHLIPDTYRVEAKASGFQVSSADNVIVYADTQPKVD